MTNMKPQDRITVVIAGSELLGIVTKVHSQTLVDALVFIDDDGDPLKAFKIPHASTVTAAHDGHFWRER